MNCYDIATAIISFIGAVVIGILAFSLAGCSNSTVSGNSVKIEVHVLPITP